MPNLTKVTLLGVHDAIYLCASEFQLRTLYLYLYTLLQSLAY